MLKTSDVITMIKAYLYVKAYIYSLGFFLNQWSNTW